MKASPSLGSGIPDYDPVRHKISAWVTAQSGKEVGDPGKAASAIVDVVRGEGLAQTRKEYYSDSDSASEGHTPDGIPTAGSDQSVNRRWPSTLALGYDADRDIREKCMDVLRVLDEWRDVACSISYDD